MDHLSEYYLFNSGMKLNMVLHNEPPIGQKAASKPEELYGNYITGFTGRPQQHSHIETSVARLPEIAIILEREGLNFANLVGLVSVGFIDKEQVLQLARVSDDNLYPKDGYEGELDRTSFIQPSISLFSNFNEIDDRAIENEMEEEHDEERGNTLARHISCCIKQPYIHDYLNTIVQLKEFDLRIFKPIHHKANIIEELEEELADFKPEIMPNSQYRPSVILPGNPQFLRIYFSAERNGKEYDVEFTRSPYLSADELLVTILEETGLQFGDEGVKHCLKLYDEEFYFCGMRPMIDYNCVRRVIREERVLILTICELHHKHTQMREYVFSEERAIDVYNVPEAMVLGSDRHIQYINSKEFWKYALGINRLFVSNPKKLAQEALESDELGSMPSVYYGEGVLASKVKNVKEVGLINISANTEYFTIQIGRLFIPHSLLSVIMEKEENYELNINEYREKYFHQETQYIDHYWQKYIDDTYHYNQIKSFVEEKVEMEEIVNKKHKLNSQEFKSMYFKLRRHFLEVSVYLVYGSRNLSKCLYTGYIARGEQVYTDEQCGVSIDIKEKVLFPIKYADIPPGTRLAFTVWFVNPNVILRYGNEHDTGLFQELILNGIDEVTPDELSKKFQQKLSRISINPKARKMVPYYQFGYKPLAGVLCNIYDINNEIMAGKLRLTLWPEITSYWLGVLSLYSMNEAKTCITLDIEIPIPGLFIRQIYQTDILQQEARHASSNKTSFSFTEQTYHHEQPDIFRNSSIGQFAESQAPATENITHAEEILNLYSKKIASNFTDKDFRHLYKHRGMIVECPEILPIVYHAIPFHSSEEYSEFNTLVEELYNMEMPIQTSMELLDLEYPDTQIRNLAVTELQFLQPHELKLFYLQLVEVLKFERSIELFEILITQAVNHFEAFGYDFFWAVKNEMRHSMCHFDLYRLILAKILENISEEDRRDILVTDEVIRELANISRSIFKTWLLTKQMKDKNRSKEINQVKLVSELTKLNSELRRAKIEYFKLPISYYILLDEFEVHKCKIMDSKKAPLMLFIHKYKLGNKDCYAGGEIETSYITMFKTGDDLRQDALVIQCMQLMNSIWLNNNINPRMKLYLVIPTGPLEGLVEIVPDSSTLAKISQGYNGPMGAFSKYPLHKWLIKQAGLKEYLNMLQRREDVTEINTRNIAQPNIKTPKEIYADIIENFSCSTAGSCVATYLLGIGDRHNDNVMITSKGNFFHIDFGHFMGNFKQKMGFKREKAPFFFTDDMRYVMEEYDNLNNAGSYERFVQMAGKAYNMIRHNGILLVVMNKMLVATGIEELSQIEDLDWLIDKLNFDMSVSEAEKHFADKIDEAANTFLTKFNNFCHIIAHK